MSVKVEKTDKNNEVKLEFKIEADKFDNAIKTVFQKSAKYFNIPGFRKGKAPFNIVERYYGDEIFYEDAFNEIVPEIFDNALKENNIEAVSKPNIDITQIGKGQELIFTAVIQTKPEVKLGKYKGIEIKKIEYNVSDDDVKHELGHLAEKNARLVNVTDRPAENNDTVVIDFEGFIDNVPFEGGKAENHEITIGSKTFIEGFEDQLVGMKIDEEKDIKVKFPKEYFSKELADKDAVFKVKLHEIKKKELPKIDDEFAKDTSEFDTLEELKKSIKDRLQEENKNREKFETEEEALKTVTDNVTIDIPSGMIETEIDNMVKDFENRLSYQGLKLDQYLKMIKKTNEEFRKQYEEQAQNAVKLRLVLEAIAKAENINVEDKEKEDKIKDLATKYGKKEEELKNNEALINYMEDSIKTEKVIKYILDNAKIK